MAHDPGRGLSALRPRLQRPRVSMGPSAQSCTLTTSSQGPPPRHHPPDRCPHQLQVPPGPSKFSTETGSTGTGRRGRACEQRLTAKGGAAAQLPGAATIQTAKCRLIHFARNARNPSFVDDPTILANKLRKLFAPKQTCQAAGGIGCWRVPGPGSSVIVQSHCASCTAHSPCCAPTTRACPVRHPLGLHLLHVS